MVTKLLCHIITLRSFMHLVFTYFSLRIGIENVSKKSKQNNNNNNNYTYHARVFLPVSSFHDRKHGESLLAQLR
jgi:hypothetical protein